MNCEYIILIVKEEIAIHVFMVDTKKTMQSLFFVICMKQWNDDAIKFLEKNDGHGSARRTGSAQVTFLLSVIARTSLGTLNFGLLSHNFTIQFLTD